jgi:hypothetical protein
MALDITTFRQLFPAFSNATTYPDATITMQYDTAGLYVTFSDRAVYLMTAHLMALSDIIAAGNTPGLVTSAAEGAVSISMTPPPVNTQFKWWLSLTPYGQQLLALLEVQSAGGSYIGGSAERSAFRKVGGVF